MTASYSAIGLFAALIVAAVWATFLIMTRASRSYAKRGQARAARGPAIPCSTCGSTMEFAGLQELKIVPGAESGALGANGSGDLPLEVYRCPTCRKVEMFLPPSAG